MDGIHDLGGRAGFGQVDPPATEPVFAEDWERTVFVSYPALARQRLFNIDSWRAEIEMMAPADYLTTPYYEHWLHAELHFAIKAGVIDPADLEERTAHFLTHPEESVPITTNPEFVEFLEQLIQSGNVFRREAHKEPSFLVGDEVVVRPDVSVTHTRRAAYVRGRRGKVVAVRGTFVFPDAHAVDEGERPEPLYTVRFSASELWATEGSNSTVNIDVWEPYLLAA
ncbi:nitrile hydratase subunit beta [Rhodococcus sp. NPDC057529]|uniref:nitrile hydratase subunit beta n=1 Tax=Rhodococcus sp. NPDC057529 TaxID=3346158 RepID=UPI00367311F4